MTSVKNQHKVMRIFNTFDELNIDIYNGLKYNENDEIYVKDVNNGFIYKCNEWLTTFHLEKGDQVCCTNYFGAEVYTFTGSNKSLFDEEEWQVKKQNLE
jgi:hypothetical protein